MLALGDLHACTGDGEIAGAAAEVAGEVELSINVLPQTRDHRPLVTTPTEFITLASRKRPHENAYCQCVSDMVHFIMNSHDLSFPEANYLAGLAGNLRVCTVVTYFPTYRMAMPSHLLRTPEELLRPEHGALPNPCTWMDNV